MARKIKSIALAVSMLVQIAANAIVGGLTAFAASGTVIGPYTITGGIEGLDYKLENNALYVLTDTPLTIANTDISTVSTVPIVVKASVSGNITLAGVNISPSNAAAFKIADNSKGNVVVTLADDTVNTLQSSTYYAGLQKNGDYIRRRR